MCSEVKKVDNHCRSIENMFWIYLSYLFLFTTSLFLFAEMERYLIKQMKWFYDGTIIVHLFNAITVCLYFTDKLVLELIFLSAAESW